MHIVLFGASGMVGQAALRECLLDPGVDAVTCVTRAPLSAPAHDKLKVIVHDDWRDFSALAGLFARADAVLFCLGVSSAGMSEPRYTGLTYDLTLAVAREFAQAHPGASIVYVSGAGTDSSERGRVMWARVKGRTENALLALPLKAAMFRPGAIVPMHGERSKTPSYRWLYRLGAPILPWLARVAPRYVTTSEKIARAMLRVVREGTPMPILESLDINALG
jgi:uncharacterized protein YbjT (DUF2867 family)